MLSLKLGLVGFLALPLAMGLVGCSSPTSHTGEAPATSGEANDDHHDHDHGDHEGHAAGSEQDPEVVAALAELSPEDRSLAEKQRICPVTDQLLGSMGPPIKVDVNGESVFICCEGCREELLKNPTKYLAKIKV